MAIKVESLYRKVFDDLNSKGFNPVPKDAQTGKDTVPEEADYLEFDLDTGEGVIPVSLSVEKINDRFNLVVYMDDSAYKSTADITNLLPKLRYTAQNLGIHGFTVKNRDHLAHDQKKRMYMKKQEQIAEGYYPLGKKASYTDAVPSVKIILQHTRQIEEGEQRYRNIAKIFLENEHGERFMAPTTKPGIARVYARHIAEGGVPNDDRWNHIKGLCEEYNKMAGFVRATKSGQFTESAQKLVNEGIGHYQNLRETLSKMAGHRGYNAYFESWTPSLMEDDTDTSNLNELFVQETVDPRIESVMPILSRLQKKISEMSEVNELSEWADKIIESEHEVEEGVMDTVKKIGGKVLDKLGHGSDEDLLKDLQKKVGIPAQHGKPGMAAPASDEKLEEGHLDVGQMMAKDGIKYDPKKEKELINLMADYMKKAGMSSKEINYLLSYNEDYIPDQLQYLPREGVTEGGMPSNVVKVKQHYAKMSPKEFAQSTKERSDDQLRAMAQRHGYGEGSDHYVDKRNAGKEGVAEGLGKDLKRLATGKDVKSRAGQEIAKSQQASMTGDNKTAHKHFKRYDKLDKLANKEQGVAEAGILKSIKRGMQGWGGIEDDPKTLVKRNKEHDDDTVKMLAKGEPGTTGSPRDLQKRVLDREMKKRGLGEEGVAEGSLIEGQYEMMLRNGQVKKFIAKDDADAKRIAAGHSAKSVIKLRGGVPAGKVAEQGVAESNGEPELRPGMRVSQGTIVKVQGNTVVVKRSNGDLETYNIHDITQAVAENLSPEQKRVGQLGPTEKVGPKGAVGKLVGAESTEPKDNMLEGQEDLDAMLRLLRK